MKQLSGKDLARILEARGWVLLRVNGSHHIYGRAGSPIRLSVPIHANRPLKRGLLSYLLKQAGVSENDV